MGILRLIFALSVLINHSLNNGSFIFPAGPSVFSFFVISGFYMALILDGKYKSILHFYFNRVLRIFPIYWLMLFLTLGLGFIKSFLQIGGDENAISHYFHYSAHLSGTEALTEGVNFILRNLTLIISKDYFSINDNNIAGGYLFLYQAWSLQMELLFYLFVPFLLKIKKNFLFFVALYFIVFHGIIAPMSYVSPNLQSFKFLSFLIYFLLGISSYKYIYKRIQNLRLNKYYSAGFLIFLAYLIFYQLIPGRIPEQDFYLGMIYYIPFAIAISFFFQMTRNNKWDRFIGELSYPIYMSHFIIAKILYSLPHSNSQLLNTFPIMIGTVLFSLLLVKFVQNPIDSFRHGKIKK